MVSQVEQKLYSSFRIDINNLSSVNVFCQQYLKFTKKGYELYILGKNGEPKKGIHFNLNLTHKYTTINLETELVSDEEGKVFLGDLKNIKCITSSIREKG